MTTETRPAAATGDVIDVDGRRLGDPHRLGEILEVLGTPQRPRYRVRWDDERESIFYPAGDTQIRRARRRRRRARRARPSF